MTVRGKDLLGELQSQKTLRLLFLMLITYGVYVAYYIKRQTAVINASLPEESKIPEGFVRFFMVWSYISLAMFFPYMMVEVGHPVETVSDIIDGVWTIAMLFWGFMARSRMNVLLQAEKGGERWFHGLWTFLFTPFYFNYKVNKLNETLYGRAM